MSKDIPSMPVTVVLPDGTQAHGEVDPFTVAEVLSALPDDRVRSSEIERNLSRKHIINHVLEDIAIRTTETAVGHRLRRPPHWYDIHLKSSAYWWETRRADDRFIYVAASSATTADIILEA